MKVLVIGGSYFLGRVFVMQAYKNHRITLINRGKYSMQEYGVKEYHLDRNDIKKLQELPKEEYDVVIDFCAYSPGEIRRFIENYPGKFSKYVFISTADVYARNVGYVKDESTPISQIHYGGETGEYIFSKICLEKELKEVATERGIDYTILRPTMIYGPFNYAPRESVYIEMIIKGKVIKYPYSKGAFQPVYVKDVANAILAVCETVKTSKEYNVCPIQSIGYKEFIKVLQKVADREVKAVPIPLDKALSTDVFLPFPVTDEETELYNGNKIVEETGLTYTNLEEGMQKTYNAFKNVYEG